MLCLRKSVITNVYSFLLICEVIPHRTESSDGSDFELAPGSREAFDWKRSRAFSWKSEDENCKFIIIYQKIEASDQKVRKLK